MVEQSESALETRLREFLAGELHRAQTDFTQIHVAQATRRSSWRSLVVAVVAVGAVIAIILFRLPGGPPGPSTGGVPRTSVTGPSVTATANPTGYACRTALAEGFLAVKDGVAVLQKRTGDIVPIVWPSGYTVRGDGDALVLVDPDGVIKAHLGDYLHVGGGVGSDDVFHGCGDVIVVAPSGIEPPPRGTVIDGFTIGVAEACSGPIGSIDPSLMGRTCIGQQTLALAALDARDPGHAVVLSTSMYTDGTQPEPLDVTGNAPTPTPPPTAHPGPLVTVFVFTLADGSVRATGIACPDSGSCIGVGSYPR
jgi:hypothetical protein